MINARDFSAEEIVVINQYITANVPYTVLQTTLPITEEPIYKARIYTTIYRLLDGAKNYVEEGDTKNKLMNLLEENKQLYLQVQSLLARHSQVNFGKNRVVSKFYDVYKDYNRNFMMNRLIDIFLVFVEKQVMISMEKITAVNLETPEGKDAYSKLMGSGESISDSLGNF